MEDMERKEMEIKIEYSDGSTFTFNIPRGKISNITMCLADQDYVEAKLNNANLECICK